MWTKNRGRADRARLAPCKEAVDRSHPGTTKLHRLEENLGAANIRAFGRRSPRDRKCGVEHLGRKGPAIRGICRKWSDVKPDLALPCYRQGQWNHFAADNLPQHSGRSA